MADTEGVNPFAHLKRTLSVNGKEAHYFELRSLNPEQYDKLPFSVRVMLESAVRNCDQFHILKSDVESVLHWAENSKNEKGVEFSFKPARVLLQDFTGVPAVVDFAAMRDAVKGLNGDPIKINPICPADLVIDHSVQVDYFRSAKGPHQGPPAASLANRPAVSDLEDTHRLPVFRSLQQQAGPRVRGSQDPNRRIPGTLIFTRGAPSVFRRRAPPQAPSPSCQGQCDGVTCMINTPEIAELPCLKQTSDRPAVSSEEESKKAAGPAPWDQSGLPVTDRVCPFHHLTTQWADALDKNQELEFERNKERFTFLKWGARAFRNMLIVPPGSGIVHQVNLEYLARVVFNEDGLLYPDSVVGTDSHTTMINGLGVLGWGVGGIEAEAVMLGQAISMVIPQVVGYRISGALNPVATSTDVVLAITKHLRQVGVVGKFVEFFGPGVAELSIADRATISNMCPEYGATVGFFPVDEKSIAYLRQTNRGEDKIAYIEAYLKAVGMFRNYNNPEQDPAFSQVVELDLSTVVPSLSGPKRPHDRVPVSEMKDDFNLCLSNKVGFKGYGLTEEKISTEVKFEYEGKEYSLRHGSVVIAAITSCTNTSNPSVMLGAGLLAKKAVESGLSVAPYVKTSLSPGSGVVTYYLKESGVTPYLEQLGFNTVGYGCMTCIGNSGPLPEPVVEAIEKGDLVACGVLSGNRNFEGRIHPHVRANYLASPLLVVAYAIAGTVDIDFEKEPLGHNAEGKPVFLRDIYPTRSEIQEVERQYVIPAMFQSVYSHIEKGSEPWNALEAPESELYPWDLNSTYIKRPPFFDGMTKDVPPARSVKDARVLLVLGDSVTTDHISPAGSIARNSPAARYLSSRGLTPRDFNSYGARRGNDDVMARGTFANIRLVNRMVTKPGPKTVYVPTEEEMDIFDAAEMYRKTSTPLIIIAGKEYGSGSSRDWAAKGPWMLGVKAVIAESFERIHRSNLAGMGIIPMQFLDGECADNLELNGRETFTIDIPEDVTPGQLITVSLGDGRTFQARLRLDTDVELAYFRHGGILNYMIRKMVG